LPDQPTLIFGVRRMTRADLGMVLAWRNHESVRDFMYTQHEITPLEHVHWFERALQDANRHLLVYEENQKPSGFVNFTAYEGSRNAVWGFYAAPNVPKGVGRRMGQAALRYGFDQSGFHKISGEALAHNEKSIRFHLSLGFSQEGVLKDHFFDSGQYHDVVCLGLLASEWFGQPNNLTPHCP